MIGKLGFKAAVTVKDTVAKKMEEERKRKGEKTPTSSPNDPSEKKVITPISEEPSDSGRPDHYISDEDPDTSFV